MIDEHGSQAPFQAHVGLMRQFLVNRKAIVERIDEVLNAQRKPRQYLQDRALLSRHLEDCYFAQPEVAAEQHQLRGQLEALHWASGFQPRQVPGLFNDLVNPAEMMIRGFYLWQQTRWPGRAGRLRYAHTLFNLYLVRCLQLLSMRVWDSDQGGASERLAQVQAVLDDLWRGSPDDQPVFVRDARWLIPLAQSPTTDELAAYLEVAEKVADGLAEGDAIEILKAHVRMLGGHLTSQIRHYCLSDGVTLDDRSIVLRTRTSNALDFALLVQGLVVLLKAYQRALDDDDVSERAELAGAICQGISADPELFLNCTELLGPYSMIEHLFVTRDSDGHATYSAMGKRHEKLLREYATLVSAVSARLAEDCSRFRPVVGAFSAYGAIFGTPTNLIEDMALKGIQRETVTRFSLEDVFTDDDAAQEKLAWVDAWRKLPHIDPKVQALYGYPQEFAEAIFERIARALERHVAAGMDGGVQRAGRLTVFSVDETEAESRATDVERLPSRYVGSSDPALVDSNQAEPYDEKKLLRDRQEGYFAVSFETAGGWAAIKKDFVTEILGEGRDAKVVGLPAGAAEALRLMCLDLV